MLTPSQISQLKTVQSSGGVAPGQSMNPDQFNSWLNASPAPKPSYLGGVVDAAKAGVAKIGEGIQEAKPAGGGGIGGLVTGVGKIVGGAAEAVTSPIAPAMQATVGKGINAIGNKISDIPAVQKFAQTPAGEATSKVAATVGDYANAAGTVAGAEGIAKSVPKVIDSIKNIDYGTKPVAPTEPPPLDTVKVSDLYNRAIKPTVVGKSTAGQASKANSQVVEGLQAIHENKPNLTFTNTDGEVTTNTTPKSVDQLSQAIGQTKASIFKQYDALAKQAGDKGVHVDAPKIATELDPVINSKSLALANPEAVKYAQQLQQRFTDAGAIDAQTAQDVIQHYNDSLKAFYRNPNYDTASKAGIDSLIANKLRASLDEGISGATGEQYQALKNKYGALSSMEKDVTHRATVWGRQNNVGFGGTLSNVASGAELARGLLTLNPADIAVSGAIKGIQKYIHYLNNPDVGVSKIFSAIDKSNPSSKGSMSESTVGTLKSGSSPEPTIAGKQAQVTQPQPKVPVSESSTNNSIGEKPTPKTTRAPKPLNSGFAKIGNTKPPQEALRAMSDFTDYVSPDSNYGKNFTPEQIRDIEQEAADLYDKYKGGKAPKTLQGLANAFGKILEANNFLKEQGRDEQGRFSTK